MRDIKRYYYDTNGKKIESYDIETQEADYHNEIAKTVINNNPNLLKEYTQIREKGVISESVFLVMKGYIYVGGTSNKNMSAMFSSISLNENTKALMTEMNQNGYYIYDIIRNELKDEQKEQIRSWHKKGMSRNEIINKVMTDMLVHLAPTKNVESKEINDDIEER